MTQRNVLFISIDDLFSINNLRTAFGPAVQTPNLDRLAGQAANFENAYATTPVCNPSRTAVLTGRSAFDTGVYANIDTWHEYVDPAATLPAQLRDAGFYTATSGKIFHGRTLQPTFVNDRLYSETPILAADDIDINDFTPTGGVRGAGYTEGDTSSYYDAQVAAFGADFLERYTDTLPFALFLGFRHPHTAYTAPKEFYDLYNIDDITEPTWWTGDLDDVPDYAKRFVIQHGLDPTVDLAEWKATIQGYLAAASHADSRLGEILDALEASHHADDTVVLVYSDHGFMLGEKDNWNKTTLWESASRAPLILYDPDASTARSVTTPVSFLDIFPTIMDVAGVTIPPSFPGQSLRAFTNGDDSEYEARPVLTHLFGSVSVHFEDLRYIRYLDGSEELYDLASDPFLGTNLAEDFSSARDLSTMRRHLATALEDSGLIFKPDVLNLGGTAADDIALVAPGNRHTSLGDGDDVYHVFGNTTGLSEAPGEGIDTVYLTNTSGYFLPENFEVLVTASNRNQDPISYEPLLQKVFGNAGDNHIRVNSGPARIKAGDGNDLTETFYSTIVFEDWPDAFEFASRVLGQGGDDTLKGGVMDDRLSGGTGNDSVLGRKGNDLIFGEAGEDSLLGGADDDTIYGGADSDLIYGQNGNDIVAGQEGDDDIDGGRGDDRLLGGADDDTIKGDDGDDKMFGQAGDDEMFGEVGLDTIFGGIGADTIYGGGDNDKLFGEDGDDIIFAGAGEDRIYAGSGNDIIVGSAEGEVLSGDTGNDRLIGGGGFDKFIGGTGVDTFVFQNGASQGPKTATIKDFEVGIDIIELSGFGSLNELEIEMNPNLTARVSLMDLSFRVKGDDISALSVDDFILT